MKIVIGLGIFFALWQLFVNPDKIEAKFMQETKRPSVLPFIMVQVDLISQVGIIVLSIVGFFLISFPKSLLFAGLLLAALFLNPATRRTTKAYDDLLKEAVRQERIKKQ